MIHWGNPTLVGREQEYVADALASTWFSDGAYVNRFQDEFAHYCGADWAVAVSSGTAALHLALLAAGVGPGDEVIVPGYTFAATANTVLHCGARPVYCDIDARTWTLDPAQLESLLTRRTKAIVPVHLFGNLADIEEVMTLAAARGLTVVEDVAQALGTTAHGRRAGTFGALGCFSFQATKLITTGEGGMVVGRDAALRAQILCRRNHGMDDQRKYWHTMIGYNYRLTNMQAAMGCAQLEVVDHLAERRRALYQQYCNALDFLPSESFQKVRSDVTIVPFGFPVALPHGIQRDALLADVARHGVECRPGWHPFSCMPLYDAPPLPVAEDVAGRTIILPLYPSLTDEQVARIAGTLAECLQAQSPQVLP